MTQGAGVSGSGEQPAGPAEETEPSPGDDPAAPRIPAQHQPSGSEPYPPEPGSYPPHYGPHPSEPEAHSPRPGSHPSQPGPYPPPAGSYPLPPGPYPPDAGPGRALPPRGRFGIRREPPPPPHRWGIGAFVLAEVAFLGLSFLIGRLVPLRESGAAGILVAVAVPTVGAAVVALLAVTLRGNGPRLDLGLRFTWDDVATGLVIGIVALVPTTIAALIYAWVMGPEGATTAVGDVFSGVRADVPVALLAMLVVVVVAPTCEEIVYRGLLWGAVAKHVRWPSVVFLVTTLLFAFAHFELTRTPLLFVVALPLGLARLLTGRLGAGILVHMINNFLPGIALALLLLGVVPS